MSTWEIVAYVVGAIGGLGGPIVGVLMIPAKIKKLTAQGSLTDAKTQDLLSDAAMDILKPAREEVERLSNRLRSAEDRADSLAAKFREALVELDQLRTDVRTLSRDLSTAHAENERLRGQLGA